MSTRQINISLVLILLSTFFAALLLYFLANTYGRKLLKQILYAQKPLPVHTDKIESDGSYSNIIFLHHSTGRHIIEEGKVRELLAEKGYSFWNHDYNFIGLTQPDGKKTKTSYDIPDDILGTKGNGNTDPDGLAILFRQPANDPPDNAFSRLLQHEVIIFKSCFPNSAIKGDHILETYKKIFMEIRDIMNQYPHKIFVPCTFPPLHPLKTNPEEARYARTWANWLKSANFLDGHPNIYVFDLFDCLADSSTNMLKKNFQRDANSGDSHPNTLANQRIGTILANFIDRTIEEHRKYNEPF